MPKEQETIAPALTALLGQSSEKDVDGTSADVTVDDMVHALRQVLVGMAKQRPLLLCVEDAARVWGTNLAHSASLLCAEVLDCELNCSDKLPATTRSDVPVVIPYTATVIVPCAG